MDKLKNFAIDHKWQLLSMMLMVLCVFIGGFGVIGADGATVVAGGTPTATPGEAGVASQVAGAATTVSNAEAAGGNGGDGLIQPDIDTQIFNIATDETVLDGIMRKAKRSVPVKGFEVDHYVIDERKSSAKTSKAYTSASEEQAAIEVPSADRDLFQAFGTVIARGVNGYTTDGKTAVSGSDLMLFIVGKDSSKNPIVRAVNGPKTNTTDEYCTLPTIPVGTELIFLANACAETQKFVAPNMVIPQPTRVYLQKMILNQIVSDYFDSVNKRVPFAQSNIAEAIVKQFRKECNRTLWIGRKGVFTVERGDMGNQKVYTTEGVRWQFKRQYDHLSTTKWTFEEVIALAKMKFTGVNCSQEALWLMGSDMLEGIQNLDFEKHKDVTMTKSEVFGFAVTQLHTVFGDFYLKYEPTLDRIGYSHSGGIFDMNGFVRYTNKDEQTTTEKVQGEEATRKCIISINALALKGTSHIWVNGEDGASDVPGTVKIAMWSDATNAPTNPSLNDTYYLTVACAGIAGSKAAEVYQWNGTAWVKYNGTIYVKQD